MSQQYLCEIRMFSFGFAPRGWAFCNGQILSIQLNAALFSLLGTTFGGNGVNNFGLPNLQGRVPLHFGTGFTLGQQAGEPSVTITQSTMPAHTHLVKANPGADTTTPSASVVPGGGSVQTYGSPPSVGMNPTMVSPLGGSQPHTNLQPFLVINFCIALTGIFPSRS